MNKLVKTNIPGDFKYPLLRVFPGSPIIVDGRVLTILSKELNEMALSQLSVK